VEPAGEATGQWGRLRCEDIVVIVLTIAGTVRDSDLPVIDDLDEIVELAERSAPLYIRYSEGPDRDREGPSRDYESGLVLPGLSVTPLEPPEWWTPPVHQWIARRICKYADLMRGSHEPRPWLLTGREIGIGPDHEPLLAECRPIAWVGQSALAAAADIYQRRFTVGRDSRSLPARRPVVATHGSRDYLSDTRCPFCFPAAITPHQLLVATEHFHVLALVGQLVEGFLGIMTHVCRDGSTRLRCMDDISVRSVGELEALIELVVAFYHREYGARALLYEHGRGGGGRSSLPGGDFVFHPHLCALPGDLEIHDELRARFSYRFPARLSMLKAVIGSRPYLYVHTPESARHPEPTVYYATDDRMAADLEGISVKHLLIELNAIDAVADWRRCPGEREMASLVAKFTSWYADTYRRRGDPEIRPIDLTS
jgi:hypothetical protein